VSPLVLICFYDSSDRFVGISITEGFLKKHDLGVLDYRSISVQGDVGNGLRRGNLEVTEVAGEFAKQNRRGSKVTVGACLIQINAKASPGGSR